LRVQEYYESPEFAKTIFTIGQYLSWYSEYESGGATYTEDTQGYNVPSWTFAPFIQGLFNPLTEEEAELIEAIRYRTDKFYVIGAYEGSDPDVEVHETAHGLYFTNESYKAEVDAIMAEHDLSALEEYVRDQGYGEHVVRDECHAFIVATAEWLTDSENIKVPEGIALRLRDCVQRYLDIERKELKNAKKQSGTDQGESCLPTNNA
jgi:hypothetical protein